MPKGQADFFIFISPCRDRLSVDFVYCVSAGGLEVFSCYIAEDYFISKAIFNRSVITNLHVVGDLYLDTKNSGVQCYLKPASDQ